jgi:HEAT repeat protein
MDIRIDVQAQAGKQLTVVLQPTTLVSEIKSHILEAWKIPVNMQKLMHAETRMLDESTLGSYTQAESKAEIMLFVNLSGLLVELEGKDEKLRWTAVRMLAELAEKGVCNVIDAVSKRLHHENWQVRRAALRAILQIAKKGDKDAIIVVSGCLDDAEEVVRVCAVETLQELSEIHDPSTIGIWTARLKMKEWSERHLVARSLGKVARKGDTSVIETLSACTTDRDWNVRQAAVATLGELAEHGDRDVITTVSKLLRDEDFSVRQSAVAALGQLVPRGDQQMINVCAENLTHERWPVREVAVQALEQTAEKGDASVIASLKPCLQDNDWHVRRAVLNCLQNFASKGDENVIPSVRIRLRDENVHVRLAADQALQQLAEDYGQYQFNSWGAGDLFGEPTEEKSANAEADRKLRDERECEVPEGQQITAEFMKPDAVVRAWYCSVRDPRRGIDVTAHVIYSLRKNGSVVANNSMGDPAFCCRKMLKLHYTVPSPEHIESRSTSTGTGQMSPIKADRGNSGSVVEVWEGRKITSDRVKPESVESAWYGHPKDRRKRQDVTEALKRGLRENGVYKANNCAGDPAFLRWKVLKVYVAAPSQGSGSQDDRSSYD